ncbi:HDL180Cp [Eremothecium sinecaudum]|uniref:HDL180Cp n=1 Tax=Eremothecium sinecaudum TaxID=45286 RepID=A0A0X8HSB0_9SACH|nr:HDL180Cp [Eremothecium sinecaudum]AMD20564.1 HDL180Cp [Eremothecium sinecaudum]
MHNIFVGLGAVLWVLLSVILGVEGADDRHMKISSLLTCMQNSQFQSTKFDVKFSPETNKVNFVIDARTTLTDEIVAEVDLIAYGVVALRRQIDFCNAGIQALCQPKVGRIDINSSYTLSESITKMIPSVVYSIPDLDAQVRVKVYAKNDMQTQLACVQAVLSNDKTVQTRYASWPIAAIAGIGVLTSGAVSIAGHSTTAAHIASNSISLFIYFQNLAITSMMGVASVPPIAGAWLQNFQWSMGIIRFPLMQKFFTWYVRSTGGTPVVVHDNRNLLSISVQKRMVKRALASGARSIYDSLSNIGSFIANPVSKLTLSSAEDVNFENTLTDKDLYTTNERDPDSYINKILVLHGIQRVAFKAGIELSNVFLTGIAFLVLFVVAIVVCLVLFKIIVELLTKARIIKEHSKFVEYKRSWGSIIKGTLFRIAIIAFPQVSLLAIWEFTQTDSPAVVVDAVVIFAVIAIVLLYGAFRVISRGRESTRLYKTPAYMLFGDSNFLNRFGFLYVQFKADKYWWLIPLLTYSFLRSLTIAVLQNHGKVQAPLVFVIEIVYFVAICVMKPYLDKRTNAFNIVIHLINLLNSIFFVFFSNLFKQPPIVSSIMAVVLFILNAVFALFLLIFTIVTCALALVHRNPDARYQPMKDDRVSFIPKVGYGKAEKNLRDLSRTVLSSSDTDTEKKLREDSLLPSPAAKARGLMDDDYDDSSALGSQSVGPRSITGSSSFADPNAFRNSPSYHKVPTAPSTGSDSRTASNRQVYNGALRRPEDPFHTNTAFRQDHNVQNNNPYEGFINNAGPYGNKANNSTNSFQFANNPNNSSHTDFNSGTSNTKNPQYI